MAKKSTSGGRGGPRPPRRPDPDLRAAKRHLSAALSALGDGDPAARMARSALSNVERRLAGEDKPLPPGALISGGRGWGGTVELRLAQTKKGCCWQLCRGRRVVDSWPAEGPEALSAADARRSADLLARVRGAQLIDETEKP